MPRPVSRPANHLAVAATTYHDAPRPASQPAALSIVIPVHNEGAGLAALHARLSAVLNEIRLISCEFVFVDDGSRDDSYAAMGALRARDPRVKAVRFARNFGKEAAMAAGLAAATGNVVVLIDGDLQHPPELIPEMLQRWRAGAQMVTAMRRSRDTDSAVRRLLSRAFYRLFSSVAEVELPEAAGDFRLFDRIVVDAIRQMPERTRFMKGITSWVGFRQDFIDFDPEPRAAGQSSWSFLRLLQYALDGFSAFSTLPLRVWSLLGLVIALVSMIYGGWLTLRTLIWGVDVPGYASIIVAVLFLSGIQLISLGVIGEYLGRVFTEVKKRPLYIVADSQGFEDQPP
jgi:glycosyltransferase involved in cell wall biosynthesis